MIHLLVGAAMVCLSVAAPGIFYLLQESDGEEPEWVQFVVATDVYLPALAFLAICVCAGVRCAIWGFW